MRYFTPSVKPYKLASFLQCILLVNTGDCILPNWLKKCSLHATPKTSVPHHNHMNAWIFIMHMNTHTYTLTQSWEYDEGSSVHRSVKWSEAGRRGSTSGRGVSSQVTDQGIFTYITYKPRTERGAVKPAAKSHLEVFILQYTAQKLLVSAFFFPSHRQTYVLTGLHGILWADTLNKNTLKCFLCKYIYTLSLLHKQVIKQQVVVMQHTIYHIQVLDSALYGALNNEWD